MGGTRVEAVQTVCDLHHNDVPAAERREFTHPGHSGHVDLCPSCARTYDQLVAGFPQADSPP